MQGATFINSLLAGLDKKKKLSKLENLSSPSLTSFLAWLACLVLEEDSCQWKA